MVSDVCTLLAQTDEKPVVPGRPGVRSDELGVPTFGELRARSASAIYDGLASRRVREYLATMRFDVEQYDPITGRVEGGYAVSEREARRIRLQYADELRADVEALAE